MIISPAYSHRNRVLLFCGLALLLTGCIQPDAPWPPAANGGSTAGGEPPPTTLIFAPTQPGIGVTSPPVTSQPLATIEGAPTLPPTQEPPTWIWKTSPVGPEQVIVMFYQDTSGNRCIRYIYRSKIVAKCPQPGRTMVAMAGSEQAADGKVYTIIAGRALDDRINAVSIEFQDGTSTPQPITERGFLYVTEGVKTPTQVIPVDQFGNLVGAPVPF